MNSSHCTKSRLCGGMRGKMEKTRTTWIDSLKGIAVCGIVMVHSNASSLPGLLGKIGNAGKNGVQLFFLLSAYLTFLSLEHFFHGKETPKAMTFRQLIPWWMGKFIRLIPLYYLALLVYALFQGGSTYWLGTQEHITAGNVFTHLFFLHGLFPHYADSIIGVEWYLGTLAIFYLLAPCLYKLIDSLEKSAALFLLSSFLCRILTHFIYRLFPEGVDSHIYSAYAGTFNFFAQFPVLIAGIMLYFLFRSQILEKIGKPKVFSYVLLVFSIIMIAGQAFGENSLFLISSETMFGLWFFLIAVSQKIFPPFWTDNKLWETLGKYSYPIYLFHFIVLSTYDKINVPTTGYLLLDWGIKYIAALLCSLAISVLLTKAFEQPAVAFLKNARAFRAFRR